MKTSDFDYHLPPELIAQEPLEPRDYSRLMVLERSTGTVGHRIFRELPEMLRSGDCIVVNNSRVFPARLWCRKVETGGRAELLLLRSRESDVWEVLARPARRLAPGTVLEIGDGDLRAEILESLPSSGKLVRFFGESDVRSELRKQGEIPLPPYINEAPEDLERYQTIYAKRESSAAAPTAGLHFTPGLIGSLRELGVCWVEVELSVGYDTFTPVREPELEQHPIHSEEFRVTKESAEVINEVRARGGRVIAVGTTTMRALETASDKDGLVRPLVGETDLFIYPGYRFRAVDILITNFHFPRTTLLMLVCAFAGREMVMQAYEEAVKRRYRFYSFGDAMIIF